MFRFFKQFGSFRLTLVLVFLSIVVTVIIWKCFLPSAYQIEDKIDEKENARQETIFTGSVQPFELEDLWILENVGKRNPESLLAFFKARSLGLHFLYEKNKRLLKIRKKKNASSQQLKNDCTILGIYMHIAQTGTFDSVSVVFSETKNARLATDVVEYIQKFWHYRPAAQATDLIMPIRFCEGYQSVFERGAQSK